MALAAYVRNADRMMTYARAVNEGIEMAFADGLTGLIPFAELPEIGDLSNLAAIELPNPYEIILRNNAGEATELPWDFARHYCDPSYESRVIAIATAGRQAIGSRIRQLREASGMTQAELATAASVGRVTLVRIESGEQSPRFETLAALADALKRPLAELLAGRAA